MSETLNDWQLRPDLVFQQVFSGNQHHWVVKDPLSATLLHLNDREYRLLHLLSRSNAPRQSSKLLAAAKRIVAPDTTSQEALLRFYRQAKSNSLLISSASAFPVLSHPSRTPRRRTVSSLLAIRLPGVPADRWFRKVSPMFGLLRSPTVWIALAVFWVLGFLIVIGNLPSMANQLTLAIARTGGLWWIQLLIVIAGAKIVHELAHGVACTLCGVPCREIGVMFLVGTPCLYCDVSDAWLIPQRYKRVLISAAGMLAEITLASLAAVVWLLTSSENLQGLCVMVMLVCTVSTVVFNGNPLLRYDGYFMLADALNAPNLASRSMRALSNRVRRIIWGAEALRAEQDGPPAVGRSIGAAWLLTYGLLSGAYRIFLIIAISSLLYHHAVAYSVRWLGLILAALLTTGVAHRVLRAVLKQPGGDSSRATTGSAPVVLNITRFQFFLGAVALTVMGGLLAPIPRHVVAPALLVPANAQDVVVSTEGDLVSVIADGQSVKPGTELLRLRNDSLQDKWIAIQGQCDAVRERLSALTRSRGDGTQVSERLLIENERLDTLNRQRALIEMQRSELVIRSDGVGRFFARPVSVNLPENTSGDLSVREGLDESFLQVHLHEGTLVGQVGDSTLRLVHGYLSQADIARVREGQSAYLNHAGLSESIPATVESISSEASDEIPEELRVSEGALPGLGEYESSLRASIFYRVTFRCETTEEIPLAIRSACSMTIRVDSRCLLQDLVQAVGTLLGRP